MAKQLEQCRSRRVSRVRRLFGRHSARHSARSGRFPAAGDAFAVHCVRDGDRQILAASGELDLGSAWQFEQELRRAEASDSQEILVDLGGLEFIDSAGMQVVIDASARSRYHSKRLMILSGPEHVHRSFELSELVSQLPFVDRRADVPLP